MKAEEEGLDWLKVAGSQLWQSHASKKARERKLFSQQGGKLEKFSTVSTAIGFETLHVTGAEKAKAGVNQD